MKTRHVDDTADSEHHPTPSRHTRWLRAVAVIAAGLVLSLALLWGHRRYQQVQAVAHVERLGGHVRYDFEVSSRGAFRGEESIVWPRWFRQSLGDAWLGHVIYVSLSATSATDNDLQHVATFQRLSLLECAGTRITGTGFRWLRDLKSLQQVRMSRTPLTPQGLAELRQLGTVHSLNLWGIEPTPELASELEQFPRLTFLEWQIGWEPGRPIASRLEKRFPELVIYSP